MKIAVLFPGQGSQYIGMGQDFIDSDSECADLLQAAEQVCGVPLGKLCSEGPMEELTRAVHLQPAITVTNLICWQAMKKKLTADQQISYFVGHSLGEYSALCAAGVCSVEDTLRLVAKRGELMEREGKKNPGAMRAVLGLNIEEIEQLIDAYSGPGHVTAANHNTEQQIVISGSVSALDVVGAQASEKGARVIPLNVAVANHSPLVADAVPDFTRFMADVEFSSPATPVIFNVTAKTAQDSDEIRSMMASQIASRVNWFYTIQAMLDDGVDTFIEVGPKPVLKGMMRKIVPKGYDYQALQFDTPEGLDKCLAKLG